MFPCANASTDPLHCHASPVHGSINSLPDVLPSLCFESLGPLTLGGVVMCPCMCVCVCVCVFVCVCVCVCVCPCFVLCFAFRSDDLRAPAPRPLPPFACYLHPYGHRPHLQHRSRVHQYSHVALRAHRPPFTSPHCRQALSFMFASCLCARVYVRLCVCICASALGGCMLTATIFNRPPPQSQDPNDCF